MQGDRYINYINSHSVDLAYDEEGDSVECDVCGCELVIDDGKYYCPECDEYWSREKFFDYIGAEPPGPECINCDNDYPSCGYCHHGYLDDDEEF